MHAFGPAHWIVLLIALSVFGIPTAVILKRAGYPAVLVLLAIIPGVWIIGLWIFAFARWPALIREGDPPPPPKKQWGPA